MGRSFEANQANYHLETGFRRELVVFRVGSFFHHVSRRAVDGDKAEVVRWNILGLRVTGPLAAPAVRVSASIGRTTLASLVGWEWKVALGVDADLSAPLYLAGELRTVAAQVSEAPPCGDSVDFTVKAGGPWRRGDRRLDAFIALERRNDVWVPAAEARTRVLLGFSVTCRPDR